MSGTSGHGGFGHTFSVHLGTGPTSWHAPGPLATRLMLGRERARGLAQMLLAALICGALLLAGCADVGQQGLAPGYCTTLTGAPTAGSGPPP